MKHRLINKLISFSGNYREDAGQSSGEANFKDNRHSTDKCQQVNGHTGCNELGDTNKTESTSNTCFVIVHREESAVV